MSAFDAFMYIYRMLVRLGWAKPFASALSALGPLQFFGPPAQNKDATTA
jgi:hypothetical protein